MDRLVVYNVIAGSIKEQLTGKKTAPVCEARRSSDGQSVEFVIHGHPVYPRGTADIIACYPMTWLSIRGGANGKVEVTPNRLNSTSVRIWQGSTGKAFMHPHIFSDGHPCWGHSNQSLCTVEEVIFKHLLRCLLFNNINDYSLEVGIKASSCMGYSDSDVLKNITKQAERVRNHYGLDTYNFIEAYQRFSNGLKFKLGMLNWS